MGRVRTWWCAFVFSLVAATAFAQGNPTGTIRGRVSDPDSLALPGVTVTVSSPALQGARAAVTSDAGDFIIPFLPPGEYTVVAEMQGFQAQTRTVGVAMAETQTLAFTLTIAALQETVSVRGSSSTEVLTTATVATTYQKDNLEKLPVGRALNDAVLLAPGVTNNGPSNNIVMSGALSYENLFLVNGVNVNENLRGQARLLFIEDAIQETKVSTGSISAEYGRFQGGVVNMITKSGGNDLSGSFRTSFTNDAWRALRPLNDQKLDSTNPTYELTGGGPIRKDQIWFFGAGRLNDQRRGLTLDQTNLNFTQGTDDKRGEGKITYAINPSNTVKGSYTKRSLSTTNNTSNGPLDYASLYDNGTDDTLTALNYTSVVSSTLFFESQFSRKTMQTTNTGSQYEDLVRGTMLIDRPTGGRYNSPTFCAVCGTGWNELRNNWDWFVKASYFLSTKNRGSHQLTAGFDNFKEMRKVDNYQSGSGYRLNVTRTIIADNADRSLYPVVDANSFLQYDPLVAPSLGNDIRTYSAFVNDAWRLNDRLSANIGLRYDRNSSKDQGGKGVVSDQQWSPRLGVTWDVKGNAAWIVNAGFARYVMGISTALVDAGSAGGRTASYTWNYAGPAFNTGNGPYLTAADILPAVFAWFDSTGGTNNTNYRGAPSIPGVTRTVSGDVTAPSSNEFTLGLARELKRGAVRVDYMHRRGSDMYGSFTDGTTGTVTDETGRSYDLEIVKNTPDARRTYHGLTTSVSYRLGRATQIGGNYTLSFARGNLEGENVGSGPTLAAINQYPEYKSPSWNFPEGYTNVDQRHKARAWVSFLLPAPEAIGAFTLGVVQRFDSGTPYDMTIVTDSRPYVTGAPRYLRPPATVTYYVAERGSQRWDALAATDLALNWSKRIPRALKAEVFFRGVITNLFNNLAVLSGNTTINSAASPGTSRGLVAFNPFTTVPAEGTHWAKGPQFGQPTAPGDYQTPRSANFSLGVRF